jgi:hypothetical protein
VNVIWLVLRFYLAVYGAIALLVAVTAVRLRAGRRTLFDVLHSEIDEHLRQSWAQHQLGVDG